MKTKKPRRSPCPIAYSLDLFGDRWTLLVLRDMVFGRKRHYRDFLASGERIATNTLANRLERLEAAGIVTKQRDPEDAKRNLYTLTEKGLDVIPVLLELIAWGALHDPKTPVTPAFLQRIRSDRESVIAEFRARLDGPESEVDQKGDPAVSNYDGEFVWYDLMTTDVEKAKAFYADIVGWGTTQWDGPQPYSMWTVKGKAIGGIRELPKQAQSAGAPPHWLAYVGAPDLTATFAKMQKLGGVPYVPPTEIPKTGRFFVFADPAGGVLAAYESQGDAPAFNQSGPGYFSWHELMSTDPEASVSFYESLFGWNKTQAMDMGEHGTYQLYGKGERSMGGMMKKPAVIPGPSVWLFYVTVSDIESAVERVKAKGGTLLNGPMEVPGGDRVAQCFDPQGAAFALHEAAKTSS